MRILMKDQKHKLYVLDHTEQAVQARGGRGKKLFKPQGPLKVVAELHLQLLPGQSIILTCPECLETRAFDTPGIRRVNTMCRPCQGK